MAAVAGDTLESVMKRYAREADRAVDRYLRGGGHPTLKEAMRWTPMAGGKRLRPVLAMMVGEAVAGDRGAHAALPVGVALEIIHNFTLVHDDIMDRSPLRRGQQTVHTKWDEATAINAGDALFARAFEVALCTPAPDAVKVEIVQKVSQMVRGIADGQQFDMEFEKAPIVTANQYLKMIELKTALMFSTGAYCSSRAAKATPRVARELEGYGALMGTSFQIQDDILDCFADEAALGKPVGKDIRNGKRTLLAIDAFASLQANDLDRFRAIFGRQDATAQEVQEVVKLFESCGARARTQATADRIGKRAVAKLNVLKASPARERLAAFVGFITARST